MVGYALPRPVPAALAEIRRRRAESAVRAAASEQVGTTLLEWALAGAVPRALELTDQEVEERAGERYDRWDGHQGYRNGTAPGYVVVGGRKAALHRSRLVGAAGAGTCRCRPTLSFRTRRR